MTLLDHIEINKTKNDFNQTEKLFVLDMVQFPFPGQISAISVSNNILIAALDEPHQRSTESKEGFSQRCLSIDLGKPDAISGAF